MFKKFSMRNKLFIALLPTFIVVFTLAVYLIINSMEKVIREIAYSEATESAYKYGNTIKSELEVPMNSARTISNIMKDYNTIPAAQRRSFYNQLLKSVLEENPDFVDIWCGFEKNELDGMDEKYKNTPGHDETGRFLPHWHRTSGKIVLENLTNYAKEGAGNYYIIPQRTGEEMVIEPFLEKIDGKDVMITTFSVPIKNNSGKVVGVVGIDMTLENYQKKIEVIKPYELGVTALFANNGTVIAHFDKTRLGKNFEETEKDMLGARILDFKTSIKAGTVCNILTYSAVLSSDVYITTVPFTIGKTKTPWSFAVGIPIVKVLEKANSSITFAIIMIIISIIIITVLLLFISTQLSKPISGLITKFSHVFEINTEKIKVDTKDETSIVSVYINSVAESQKQLAVDLFKRTEQINNSANKLLSFSELVASTSAQLLEQTNNSASSSEQVSANVSTVSTSAEEMSSSIKEISKNTTAASSLAEESQRNADEANTVMSRLESSSMEIGNIVKVINSIAEQTNLLALNATIEAARAGESGKGFAVVANEVKDLAKESAKATEDITNKIKVIQSDSQSAIDVISGVVNNIRKISDISSTIASAVEEQSVTTSEVNRNLSEASQGVTTIVENNSSIAQSVNQFSKMAGSLKESANELLVMARELENQLKLNYKI